MLVSVSGLNSFNRRKEWNGVDFHFGGRSVLASPRSDAAVIELLLKGIPTLTK